MQLIRLLQEASTLNLVDLKKSMKKDKRIDPLFKQASTLADVTDPEAFLATVKYWLLNNESVKAFVKTRDYVKDIDLATLSGLRKLRGPDLTAREFDKLKDFVSNLFKEHTSVSKGTLSRDARKDIDDFVNTNGYRHDLKGWVAREIGSVDGIRPSKPTLLYRGLLFSESSLEERERYDGTLEKGNGLKFLEAIREGTRIVDLEWDRYSSWTTEKSVAEQFAKFGPASSHTGAMMQWFDRQRSGKAIDGALGFIISTLADPEDILLDVRKYRTASGQNHGDEAEMILKPGTYTCRISKKYNTQGEVDPTAAASTKGEDAISKIVDQLESITVPYVDMESAGNHWSHSAVALMKKEELFKKLVSDGLSKQVGASFDQMSKLYKETMHDLGETDLSAEGYVGKPEARQKISTLSKIVKRFRQTHKHSKFITKDNSVGTVAKHEMSGEDYRTTINPVDLRFIERDLLTRGKIDDKETARSFEQLATILGVELPKGRLSTLGAAKQEPVINATLDAFFKRLNVSKPENRLEAIKLMITLMRKAYRNFDMLKELNSMHEALGNLK
jgi:hypothetical protein